MCFDLWHHFVTSISRFNLKQHQPISILRLPSLKVIVERAAEARENDHEAKIKKKNQDRSRSMEDLAGICAADLQIKPDSL